ncbi:MAG: DNA-processing protein DprA [Clostridia bacterium]|nr:DNA-processing protein DprA [Clostridia bacterium]
MNYSDDAFVTMLLTMALSPNREEYARPFSTQELKRLEEKVRAGGLFHIGRLMNVDIGGLMLKLDISEEEAYRIYTLLNRSVQLSYTVENHLRQGIEVVTCYNDEYPSRLKRRMEEAAPPVFYRCGNQELLTRPMLAIVGISGVKTSPEVRDSIDTLVRNGVRMGYTILTGGELGVSRVAMNLAMEYGGTLVEVLGGDMQNHVHEDGIAEMLAAGKAAVISLEHPEALFTVSHAIARNKLLFSLAEAAFVFNTDGKRGEMDAIRNRYCDWIYAWTGYANNQPLIARGAIPATSIPEMNLSDLSRHWRNSESEQMSLFDMLE